MKLCLFKNCLVLPVILLAVCTALAHSVKYSFNTYDEIVKEEFLTTNSTEFNNEQVILHVANNFIENGIIFFKGYIFLNFSFKRESVSQALFVELLDAELNILKSESYRIINGQVNGNVALAKKMNPGTYILRAYTKGMKGDVNRYATQKIIVGKTNKDLSEINNSIVAVISEGGVLLNGYENKLIIKLKDDNLLDNGLIGKVLDDGNINVAKVYKFDQCLATTLLKPSNGKKYNLELNDGSTYPIPNAVEQGYQLQVNTVDSDNLSVRVRATRGLSKEKLTLVATVGGLTYLKTELNFKSKNELNLQMDKSNFPDGFYNFKIIDEEENILVTRPFYVNQNQLRIAVNLISTKDNQKTINLRVTDAFGNPFQTELSVSINPTIKSDLSDSNSCNEESMFNLFTEAGEASSTDVKDKRKALYLNDLGVQLFNSNYKSALANDTNDIESGLELRGYAYDLNNSLLTNTTIQVMGILRSENVVIETKTDDQGLLSLKNLDITGEAELVFRTEGDNTKERLVKIRPIANVAETIDIETTKRIRKSTTVGESPQATQPSISEVTGDTKVIALDEVEVVDDKVEKYYSASNYGLLETSSPRMVKYQDFDRPRTIEQMISEFSGVIVNGWGTTNPSVNIPKATAPIIYVLDGFVVAQEDQPTLDGRTPFATVLNLISPGDVYKIELLWGPDAAVFGSRGAGGAFVISTRSGSEYNSIDRKDGKFTFKGYRPEIDFESYQREISNRQKEHLNLLYWNPSLKTNENGEATITVDDSKDYDNLNLSAYTITPQGQAGKLSKVL